MSRPGSFPDGYQVNRRGGAQIALLSWRVVEDRSAVWEPLPLP